MQDCYRTLQVDPTAEPEVVDAAWRRLAQLYHPDGLRPDGIRMRAINAAHDVLKDPLRRAAHDRDREQHGAAAGAARTYTSPEVVACSWHSDRAAVSWCELCWQPLCRRCAELRWPSPLCARCARRHVWRRQLEIAWPLAYALAWLIAAVLWSSFASAWAPSQPWARLEQLRPSAVIGYFLGCGVVGSVDLALLGRRSGHFAPAGCPAVLFTLPLALAAGSILAPIRTIFATVGWLRALLIARRVEAHLRRAS